MADLELPDLPAASALTSADLLYATQAGLSRRATIGQIETYMQAALSITAGEGHFIDVKKDFGATGNGSTNDRTAIQNAINAAPTEGGIIFFPRGHYIVGSTLNIPISGNDAKPVILQGEGMGLDGDPGTFGGGASCIEYTGTGICIDAQQGTPVTSLNPGWKGGIRDLGIHGSGGSSIGLRTNSFTNGFLHNVLFRRFGTNIEVNGEMYYGYWHALRSYRGKVVLNEKINGHPFFACQFSKYSGTDAALQITRSTFSRSGARFFACWFERNNGTAVSIRGMSQALFDACYWEGNGLTTAGADIDWQPLGGNTSQLIVKAAQVRHASSETQTNHKFIKYANSSGTARPFIVLEDIKIAAEVSGSHVVQRVSDSSSALRLSAKRVWCAAGQESNCPLWSGTLGQLNGLEVFEQNLVTEP